MVCKGKPGSSKITVENTYGILTGSLIRALALHQIPRMNWLEGLVTDAPPRLDAGVLKDSTGFARLGHSLENKALRTPQADS